MSNLSISEQYARVAKDWVELDSAASMLEETKSAVLSQMMGQHASLPVNRAEMLVKGSPEWSDFITKMVKAREAANLKKVHLEFLRMKFAEWNSSAADERLRAKL